MLILTRREVAGLLSFAEYVEAVEQAFRAYAEGRALTPALAHVSAQDGNFHIKAGGLLDPEPLAEPAAPRSAGDSGCHPSV